MRAALLVLLLAAGPALAQLKVPDNIPTLPPGTATCNDARTLCLVNFSDLMTDQLAIDIAGERLAAQASEIERLKSELAAERASKIQRCAVVTPRRNTATR